MRAASSTYTMTVTLLSYMQTSVVIVSKRMIVMTEQNIILAVIGMVGLFATATIWQRANRITTNYYKATKRFN
jgi:hypothetical protein